LATPLHPYRQLAANACPAFAFRYLKLHDSIDVDAFVTELTLLKNISSSFVPYTFETARVVSKALTPVLSGIYKKCWMTVTVVLGSTNDKHIIVFCT